MVYIYSTVSKFAEGYELTPVIKHVGSFSQIKDQRQSNRW